MSRKKSIHLIIILFLISGCAARPVMYDIQYVPQPKSPNNSSQLNGKILVVMSPAEEAYKIEAQPSSYTGGALNASFHVGEMTKQISLTVYSELFREGADFSNTPLDGYTISVIPSVAELDYRFEDGDFGFSVRNALEIKVNVKVIDEKGSTKFSRLYRSGTIKGQKNTGIKFGDPLADFNKLLHRALYDLLKESSVDLKQQMQ